jgi:hypothetical protein
MVFAEKIGFNMLTCIRVLANSIGEHVIHANDRAIEPAMRGARKLQKTTTYQSVISKSNHYSK